MNPEYFVCLLHCTNDCFSAIDENFYRIPMRKLPSLSAVRAFESAGRHLSFQAAGDELHVTPSAISHQIKALESQLGVSLFNRLTRRIELTQLARSTLCNSAKRWTSSTKATVASARVTMSGCLICRWHHHLRRHGSSHICSTFMNIIRKLKSELLHHRLPDFRATDVDLAILFGPGDWKGCTRERVRDEDLVLLCSPNVVHDGIDRRPRGHDLHSDSCSPRSVAKLAACEWSRSHRCS